MISGPQTHLAVVCLFLLVKKTLSLLVLETLLHFDLFLSKELIHHHLGIHALSQRRTSGQKKDSGRD
jgi:hypothetical protein